jgi:hypothetical protein
MAKSKFLCFAAIKTKGEKGLPASCQDGTFIAYMNWGGFLKYSMNSK